MWGNRCARVQTRLPLLASGELIGLDRRRAERHLLVCARCQQRLSELKKALDVLHSEADRSLFPVNSLSLWPALARQIEETRRPVAVWSTREPRLATWATAALILGILLTTWFLRPTGDVNQVVVRPPQPPVPGTATQAGKLAAPIAAPVASKGESPPKEDSTIAESSPPRIAVDSDRSGSASESRYTQ
jgi:hypothetical protein